jgi:hypothetical protein
MSTGAAEKLKYDVGLISIAALPSSAGDVPRICFPFRSGRKYDRHAQGNIDG